MGYSILTPTNSFVRFDDEPVVNHCIHGEFKDCLPVYADDDVAFQFVVQADTEEEAAALCQIGESGIQIGLVSDCLQEGFDVEFDEQPERFKISPLQVLYNWPHGFPGMVTTYEAGECFRVKVVVGETQGCSNCFQRIPDDCFTSVIEYGNDENFAGFNYCNSGQAVDPSEISCKPTIFQFVDKSTQTIPYTTGLKDMYGDFPTVQVWIYDGSGLVNMGITASFDTYPPNQIFFDFGGPATGIIVIR